MQLPVLFFSVVVHEFCHGWVAYAYGDDTAEKAGRLTLNPVSHVDAFGTIFLPLLCFFTQSPMFGWAKPVPVDPRRLKDPVRDMVRVAIAGPGANIFIAVAAAVTSKIVSMTGMFSPAYEETVRQALLFAVTINLVLAFFNLIPVEPLDGFKVVLGLLPVGLAEDWLGTKRYGLYILIFLIVTGVVEKLVFAPVGLVLRLLV